MYCMHPRKHGRWEEGRIFIFKISTEERKGLLWVSVLQTKRLVSGCRLDEQETDTETADRKTHLPGRYQKFCLHDKSSRREGATERGRKYNCQWR